MLLTLESDACADIKSSVGSVIIYKKLKNKIKSSAKQLTSYERRNSPNCFYNVAGQDLGFCLVYYAI